MPGRESAPINLEPFPGRPSGDSLEFGPLLLETAQGWRTIPLGELFGSLEGDGVSQSVRRVCEIEPGLAVSCTVRQERNRVEVAVSAAGEVHGWSLSLAALQGEVFTGLMERTVDGPQNLSWAPGVATGLDLAGERLQMLVQPSTALYAPFFLSSRGYGLWVDSTWPGSYDLASWWDRKHIRMRFEGGNFRLVLFTGSTPDAIVRAYVRETGLPFHPPRWCFGPWRWRDEHANPSTYYDGSPANGPFNAHVMEDVLMMQAFGIPCSVYWIDRPWGPGTMGYDDFEIDLVRMPAFAEMVAWLESRGTKTLLWIGPFYQGKMKEVALKRGYTLPGQYPTDANFPLVDFTNQEATRYWQDGLAKLLRFGVAGFKLDRSEEDIPHTQTHLVADGRSVREIRNVYPVLYAKAAYDEARRHRGGDFLVMPRAAYSGSSQYAVFWGGDIGGTQEGLRASIIAMQRAAIMGYSTWGADTCGYLDVDMDQEVCSRWLGFSCFNPIMEVGPTQDRGFWNMLREPAYDTSLIALWRTYARLHARLSAYSEEQARLASATGMPIVRPLFFADPAEPLAWKQWDTFLYGPDLLVAPVWKKGERERTVYLPRGNRWREAWRPSNIHEGGRSITIAAPLHQIPFFIREGSDVGQVVGDLEAEHKESLQIAGKRPDLQALARSAAEWLDAYRKARQ